MFWKLTVTFMALVFTGAISAQQPALAESTGIKRTLLQKVEVPGTNYETILVVAEIAPGVNAGRHTHPGPETGTVTEGEMVLMIDGQPEKTLRVGDSFQIPGGTGEGRGRVCGSQRDGARDPGEVEARVPRPPVSLDVMVNPAAYLAVSRSRRFMPSTWLASNWRAGCLTR